MAEVPRLRLAKKLRPWILPVGVLSLIALAALAHPHGRALWWLHYHSELPETYVVPVRGVDKSELEPNYGTYRPLGPHEGIDILAAAGTPVVATASGIVVDDRPSKIGGTVLWILGSGRRLYYYAHMRDLAKGIHRGRYVALGQPIGSVGTTGNAAGTPPHLHFAIYTVRSNFLFSRDGAIDPYPLLVDTGRSAAATASSSAGSPRTGSSPIAVPFDPLEAHDLAPEEIVARAQQVLERFGALLLTLDPFLGIDADIDGRVVSRLYRIAPLLTTHIDEFRRAATVSGAARTGDLELPTREIGIRLFASSSGLELLLDEQQRCRPRHLGVLLSALESLALSLEQKPSVANSEEPRAYYWVFEDHLPGIVPRKGGRSVLVGSHLWSDSAPEVTLVDRASRETLVRLEPQSTARDDWVALVLEPSTIQMYAGHCLSLQIRPTSTSGVLWWKNVETGPALHIPLCVPKSYVFQYRVAGFLGYRRPLATHPLESNQILFSNTSCNEPKRVSKTLEWPLHPQGRIVDMGSSKLYEINESKIECQLAENTITCSGQLDPAFCDQSGRVDTEWHYIFSPTEEYPDFEEHRSAAISPGIEVLEDEASACVELRRDQPSDETAMWFDVFAINGHQHSRFYSAPRQQLRNRYVGRYDLGPISIEADFDPAPRAELAQICVAIRSPRCGY
jgi:hypothetical protein